MTRKTIAQCEAETAAAIASQKETKANWEAENDLHDQTMARMDREKSATIRERDAALVRADELRAVVHGLELRNTTLDARLALLGEQERKADGDEMISAPRRMIEAARVPEYGGGMIDSTFGRDRLKPWWK